MEEINLKVFDLSKGTEFRLPGIDGWNATTDLRLENAIYPVAKEYVQQNSKNAHVIGDSNCYFIASVKAGGVYQTKISVFVAGHLLTNLKI